MKAARDLRVIWIALVVLLGVATVIWRSKPSRDSSLAGTKGIEGAPEATRTAEPDLRDRARRTFSRASGHGQDLTNLAPLTHGGGETSPAIPLVLRPELEWLERSAGYLPTPERIRSVTEEDLDVLLEVYRRQKALTNRAAATVGLTKLGGIKVYAAFTNTLGSEFSGGILTGRESSIMDFTMDALGLIAGRTPEAAEFLKDARQPEFWEEFCKWRSDTELHVPSLATKYSLASAAWAALGFLNDATVEAERVRLQETYESGFHDIVSGGVVSGAYYRDIVDRYGIQRTFELWARPGAIYEDIPEWKATESGRAWTLWAKAQYGK